MSFKLRCFLHYSLVLLSICCSRGFIPPSSLAARNLSPLFAKSSSVPDKNDNSFEEYSRCLTPKEELNQINYELALKRSPIWKRVMRRPMGGIRRFLTKIGGAEAVNPGKLILVRGGESEFSKNFTFTGYVN